VEIGPLAAKRADWGQRVTVLVSVLTAAAALAALFYTNQANRDSLNATRDQQHLVEQGQVTDRFSKAIEQLGSNTLDIRLVLQPGVAMCRV
jgi:type VI protein secretion system component VasK